MPVVAIKLTERYDLSIPATAEGDVKKSLQTACDKYDIWPFRVVKGKKGTAVSLLRNPATPQYKYTAALTDFINYLKLDLSITTIVMVRVPCKVNLDKLPEEIHEICQEKTEDYSKSEKQMLKNLEEDIGGFNSHVIQQIEEADYDTPAGREANMHAIRRQRFEKRCPVVQETEPVYYNNGRQKTCEGQMTFDIGRLLK